ncbi:MAG: inositol monophosphatase family protein [Candidatus Lokiarchaeota archaeon]
MPIEKDEKIKLSRWLEKSIPHYFPNIGALIEIIDIIAEATIPIRGLLERGITSREIEERMNIEKPKANSKNIYDEIQIHEDILTHSIILKALQEREANFSFIASEEAEPALGEGKFGITIDPVDGSSNVAVNRTVGTIVGIYNENGHIICSFYVLYGIFTNLVLAINGIAVRKKQNFRADSY